MKKSFMKKLSLLLAVAVFITSIALGWSTNVEAASTRTKKISISDESQITVLKGGYLTFKPVVTPANSTDYLRFVSSNPSVVKVNLYTGKMQAIKPGKATITVISKATKTTKNGDKANVKDSVVVKVVSNTATTNSWANTLINSPSTGTVKLSTKKAVKLTTPAGDFSNKYLAVNMPEGHVVNNGVFKSVSVYAIKDSTYYENAKGNTIHVSDKDARVVVTDKASVKALNLKASNGTLKLIANGPVQALTVKGADNTVNLTANSTLGAIDLSAKTVLNIFGKAKSVDVKSSAEGTKINSSVPVKLDVSASAEVVLTEGAENSTVTTKDAATVKVTNNTAGVVTVVNASGTKTEVKAGESVTVSKDSVAVVTPVPTTTPGSGSGSGGGTTTPSNNTATVTAVVDEATSTATYILPVEFGKLKKAVVTVDKETYSVSKSVIDFVASLLNKESTYINLWEGLDKYESVGYTVNGSTIKINGEGLTKDVTFDNVTYVVTVNKENSSVTLNKKDGNNTYTLSKNDSKTLKIQCTDAPQNLKLVSFYVEY